jgi:hypothetical protein
MRRLLKRHEIKVRDLFKSAVDETKDLSKVRVLQITRTMKTHIFEHNVARKNRMAETYSLEAKPTKTSNAARKLCTINI